MDRNAIAAQIIKLAKALLSDDKKEEKEENLFSKRAEKEEKVEQETLFKSKKAMPMLVLPRRLEKYHLQPIMATLRNTLGMDHRAEPIEAQYLTFREGSSNKFHYFAIFGADDDADGNFVGGNAYGRIGYSPKAIEIARGSQARVEAAVEAKIRSKLAKGYRMDSI